MAKKTLTQFRFLVFGAGAIGAYIGGSLVIAGQKVVFMVHSKSAENLRKVGLNIGLVDGFHKINKPDVVVTIEEALTLGPFDVAIFSVKGYDTHSVVKYVSPYAVALPPFLCLQNGVDNEAELVKILGIDKVIVGTVTSAVSKQNIGDIKLEKLRGIGIASGHVLVPTLVNVFNEAGLRAKQFRDGKSMKWSKMLTNLLCNASSAILDMTPSAIFSHPGLYGLEIKQFREAMNVMAGLGIKVTNLPHLPVWLMSRIIQITPPQLSRPLLMQVVGKGRGTKMPSFHIDLYNGKGKTEAEYLNGSVVRYGQKLGVPTPVNQFFYTIMSDIQNGKLLKETFTHQPDKMIGAFENKYYQG